MQPNIPPRIGTPVYNIKTKPGNINTSLVSEGSIPDLASNVVGIFLAFEFQDDLFFVVI